MAPPSDKIASLKPLFWDYKWESVVNRLHHPYVALRVLEWGNRQQIEVWLEAVGWEAVCRALQHPRVQKLMDPRTRTYWELVLKRRGLAIR